MWIRRVGRDPTRRSELKHVTHRSPEYQSSANPLSFQAFGLLAVSSLPYSSIHSGFWYLTTIQGWMSAPIRLFLWHFSWAFGAQRLVTCFSSPYLPTYGTWAFESQPGPDLNDFWCMSSVFQLSGIQRKTDLPTSSKWQDPWKKIGEREEPLFFFFDITSYTSHRNRTLFENLKVPSPR